MRKHAAFLISLTLILSIFSGEPVDAEPFKLSPGDHVCYIGNTTADRMQHHGWLETYLHALHPAHKLVFRNLGFPGDELTTRSRSANFGSPDQWLSKCEADVVFCFFGYNEALRGATELDGFKANLSGMIDHMRGQTYNGASPPRLVIFSPIAHEDLDSRHLPDGSENNAKLAIYSEAMREVCKSKEVTFVDMFTTTRQRYKSVQQTLTMNGIHLLDHGNREAAQIALGQLLPQAKIPADETVKELRDAVLDKNYYWFSRYRVVDGYNVYGGRSRLAWHGQSNADVMRREMEIFDVMTANRDRRVWAVAKGSDITVKDDNLPEELAVKTNKFGPLDQGAFPYLGGKEAIAKMKVAEGMEVNLFASEEMFPRLINPVQMAVDTDSRLWAAVWPSYPHWNPKKPRNDALVILPDDNQDGVADDCIVFADELNSVTGFEFWNGGVLVFAPPELWFLKDTDGDDRADVKIRMLQGVSSADTHHSANAVVVGPDGWLYWSRGVFNVANFETPTQTYRSGQTGVHRFNPRTFEVEFHFPIGPNPHGDVFDQWGYQFANDGTTGTGSYVNIGKGIGNKQWFQKRVRPVPATGILSSSHFPERNQGNFLICNVIGFLGVLQHEVQYDGADISAVEVEPIVYSSDPNFRPSDLEVGGDGALYIADWHNTLIGHMQHNMRDPNRDDIHGRIYRVTAKGRPLVKPAKMKGKPVDQVCENFFAKENGTRYRARLELSSHATDDLMPKLASWVNSLSPKRVSDDRDEAQALLECLWVHEEHRIPNIDLVKKVFQAEEPRVRAAAIRTLGHWAGRVDGWEEPLEAAAADASALVRAEAVKAAVEFQGLAAAEVIFKVATRPLDAELESVLKYARGKINVDEIIAESVKNGRKLSAAGQAYALQQASASALLQMEKTDAVYEALLKRTGIPVRFRKEAIRSLAKKQGRSEVAELLARISMAEDEMQGSLGELATMLTSAPAEGLVAERKGLEQLANRTRTPAVRTVAYANWIRAGGSEAVWSHAGQSRERIQDLLAALKMMSDKPEASDFYSRVRPLMFALPKHLQSDADQTASTGGGPAVSFDYYAPNPTNVALETLNKRKPRFSGKLDKFETFVPKGLRDAFATKQTAALIVPRAGTYQFFLASDDGSRLYINQKEVINNDGLHGMVEKSGSVALQAGYHEIIVTYFDNGGGDGLRVMWQGPGMAKQEIGKNSLTSAGRENLRVVALSVVSRFPGRLNEKIADLTSLIAEEEMARAALGGLAQLSSRKVAQRLSAEQTRLVLDSLVSEAKKTTPVAKQEAAYTRLLNLGDQLAAESAEIRDVLKALRASIPEKADPTVMALGKQVFHRHSHCATCHQTHGQGLPNLYPPLDGSLWATGSEDRLIRIVLDGMHGTIEVKGKTYSSPPLPPMTGFRHLLSDQEIAAVLTYVRNSWTNRAASISPDKVAAVRKIDRGDATFWFAGDLMEKYPLEDGRVSVAVKRPDGWVPKFVKAWKMTELQGLNVESGRSHATGKLYFSRLGCIQCHRLQGEGGVFGPDLGKLDSKKTNSEYILRSILEPSKDIEPKYAMRQVVTDNGRVITGLVVQESDDEVQLITDPLRPSKPTIIKRDQIDEEVKTASSIMPEGLLNWLSREEIEDLIAYVLAGGDPNHPAFRK